MNNKLQSLITLFNEKKIFFNNHPDFYHFIRNTFSQNLSEGTEIEIIVKNPTGTSVSSKITIDSKDQKFVNGISKLFQ